MSATQLRPVRRLRLPGSAPVSTYEEYRASRYFGPLDGLRAISILLVLTWHVNSQLWGWLSGWEGVAIFFVISGFLITTLCLREEEDRGSVSLTGFYIRRACRIFPLYYLILAFYVVVLVGLDWHGKRGTLTPSLPYYLSYLNDFSPHLNAPSTAFSLSWSLGVEEKFYLLWPLLAFVLLRGGARFRFLAAGVLVLLPFAGFDPHQRYLSYSQILVGCLLALGLHYRSSFERLRHVARFPWLVLALFVATHLLVHPYQNTVVAKLYAPVVALLILTVLVGRPAYGRVLTSRPLVYIGKRAYGIYLVQMICLEVVRTPVARALGIRLDAIDMPTGHNAQLGSLAILAVGTLASLAAADVLYRLVEQRFIGFGRVLSARVAARASARAAAAEAAPPPIVPPQVAQLPQPD